MAVFCFSCEDMSNDNMRKATTRNTERTIDHIYQQIVQRYDLPMDSLNYFYQQLDDLSSDQPRYIAVLKICKATYFRKTASFYLAVSHFNSALEYLPQVDTLTNTAYVGLGTCYKHLGDFSTSLNYYQQSIQVSESLENRRLLAGTSASLGQLYFEKGNETEAKLYIDKVFELQKEQPTDKTYLIALHTLANIEGKNGNFEKAMKLDSIGIELSEKSDNDVAKITFQDNLAMCFLYYLKDYEKAAFYFNENLKIDKKLNNPNWIADTYINLAEVETAKGNYADAENYFQQAITICTESNLYNNVLKAYSGRSEMYKKQGHFEKALSANETYLTHYKKYFSDKSEQAFAEYRILYETEKKEKQIAETRLVSKQKSISLMLLGALVVFVLVLFRNFRVKTHYRQRQLALENELLKEQTHSRIQEQRLEISRDLHDSLGAQLTFIHSVLDGLKNSSDQLTDAVNSKINLLFNFSENSIAELKNTLWALNSREIHLFDLKSKILNFINNASEVRQDMKFDFEAEMAENSTINSKLAVHLFRAVQEMVNNAIKHAQASEIAISLRQNEKKLTVQVTDNGSGFDFENEKNKSFGLRNIQSRITAVNGQFHLETAVGKGTVYTIEIIL